MVRVQCCAVRYWFHGLRPYPIALLLLLWGVIPYSAWSSAVGGFSIGGRPVEPRETNFAGARHATPTYGISVQINPDTQPPGPLELTVVDALFQELLTQHRPEPYLQAHSLPIVFIPELKMRRFLEGPTRLLFDSLETEIKRQPDVYLAPTAIFIRDTALADAAQLRAALRLGMSYLFHRDVYRAIVGLDHAIPRSAE